MNAPDRDPLSVPTWLLAAVSAALVLGGLGSLPLLDNNEGLYAEIAREMLHSGDAAQWVIPHLNGLPYLEKPPLLYWLTASSFALFGESEWSARLVPALSSLACVALLAWFGGAVGRPRAGRLAGLMFVSGAGVIAMSRLLLFDMLLAALLTGALMHAYLFLTGGRTAHLRWASALLAFAVLAKGFVALALFAVVIGPWIVLTHRPLAAAARFGRRLLDPAAIVLFLAIAVPWHVAASLCEPAFAWLYFVNEHVLRFLGQREPRDFYTGHWWYYLPRMAAYLFPWTLFLLALPGRKPASPPWPADAPLQRFVLLAWLMPLAFFLTSTAKGNYYMVAVMPLAALHLACTIVERELFTPMRRALPGVLVLAGSLFGALHAVGAPQASGRMFAGLPEEQFWIVACLALVVVAGFVALLAYRSPARGLVAYAGLSAAVGLVAMTAVLADESNWSM